MDLLTWHKTNPIPTCSNKYLSDTKYVLFFRSKGKHLYGTYETKRKWYVSPLNVADKKLYGHPTIKPLEFVKAMIGNSVTKEDGHTPIVLDPFMGSGTTAVATKELGFDFIGFEIDPEYHAIAVKRLQESDPSDQPSKPMGLEAWGMTS